MTEPAPNEATGRSPGASPGGISPGVSARLIRAIVGQYTLPWRGTHGLAHWGRVLENGIRIAEAEGGDPLVVQLFAVLHDARRINEGWDHGHGRRGADLAAELRGAAYELSDRQFEQLRHACAHHTDGRRDGDATVRSCWDADRLDLGRVRITPDPAYLATGFAARPDVIEWAEERSRSGFVPAVTLQWEEWARG